MAKIREDMYADELLNKINELEKGLHYYIRTYACFGE